MSFWSLIGLADKNSITSLREEVQSLREENRILQEELSSLAKSIEMISKNNLDVIITAIDENRKKEEMADNNNMELLKNLILNLQKDVLSSNSHISGNVDEIVRLLYENNSYIKNMSEEIHILIKTSCTDICSKLEVVKTSISDVVISNTTSEEKLLKELLRCIEQSEQIISDISSELNNAHTNVLDNKHLLEEGKRLSDCQLKMLNKISTDADNIGDIQENIVSLSESVKYLWSIMKAVWVDSLLTEIDSVE